MVCNNLLFALDSPRLLFLPRQAGFWPKETTLEASTCTLEARTICGSDTDRQLPVGSNQIRHGTARKLSRSRSLTDCLAPTCDTTYDSACVLQQS